MDIFSFPELASFGLILLAAAALQSSIGFAAGLIAIPLMNLAGATLPQAIVMSLVGSLVQTLAGAYRLRRLISIRRYWRPIAIRTLTLPLGVYVLWRVSSLDPAFIRQLIGAVILLFVSVQGICRVRPSDRIHPAWEWLAFGCSGFTLGLVGMGGPPIVLWVMAHRWSSRRARAFLFSVYLAGMIPQALLLFWAFGADALHAGAAGLVLSPMILCGAWVGLAIGDRISRTLLRRIAYVVLVLIGLGALLGPMWK
ncbi:MAG: sulfite exporter TauE/SafE family protein [Planctomycetales bacterium]|nr:sulfite exporter TauE/SafE family protein [Planctomycetales bacterium]